MDRPEAAKERSIVFTCTATCADPIHDTPWSYDDYIGNVVTIHNGEGIDGPARGLADKAITAHAQTGCTRSPLVAVTAGDRRMNF